MAVYKLVRSLRRGFEILAVLNRQNGASIAALSAATGIHRTTVYRVLETLKDLGYLWKGPADDSYRLTFKVRQLSDGFDDDAWISLAAVPVLRALQRKVVWPTNVATLDYDSMVVRETTHRYSPLSIHHGVVGERLPILRTAMGRAYFCFCPDTERRRITRLLQNGSGVERQLARDGGFLRELLRTTRRDGYAVNGGEREKNIAAIALPVIHEKRVFACINMVFFSSAMPVAEAVHEHLAPMKKAVVSLQQQLKQDDGMMSGR